MGMKYKSLYSIFSGSPFCSKRDAWVTRGAWPYHAFTLLSQAAGGSAVSASGERCWPPYRVRVGRGVGSPGRSAFGRPGSIPAHARLRRFILTSAGDCVPAGCPVHGPLNFCSLWWFRQRFGGVDPVHEEQYIVGWAQTVARMFQPWASTHRKLSAMAWSLRGARRPDRPPGCQAGDDFFGDDQPSYGILLRVWLCTLPGDVIFMR